MKQKKVLILVRVIASNSPLKKGSKANKPKSELSLNYLPISEITLKKGLSTLTKTIL